MFAGEEEKNLADESGWLLKRDWRGREVGRRSGVRVWNDLKELTRRGREFIFEIRAKEQ